MSGSRRPLVGLGLVGLGLIGLGLIGPIMAILLSATPASAHDATNGGIALEINDRRVVGTAPVRFTELGYVDTTGDDLIDGAEVAAQEAELAPSIVDAVRDHVGLTIDGESTEIIGAGVAVADSEGATAKASECVSLRFATGPHDGDVSKLSPGWTFTSPSSEVVVKLVTAFTIGHAISLCLVYLDVVSVPASIVEPIIALSVVAAAGLALRGSSSEARRWMVDRTQWLRIPLSTTAGLIGLVWTFSRLPF